MSKRKRVEELWTKMCEYEGIDPSIKFIVFSDKNPFSLEFYEAMTEYTEELFEVEPGKTITFLI